MDFEGYDHDQKVALLDLLLFGMYLDGNLSAVEDRRVAQLVETMGFESPDAKNRFLDAAYTRTRQRSNAPEAVKAFVSTVALKINDPDLRRRSYNLLVSMMSSDNNVAEPEREVLRIVREEFKVRSAMP